MTSFEITIDNGTRRQPSHSGLGTRVLLSCGAVSSLLYVVTDALASYRYEGYSIGSQTISELGAIGAPHLSFLAPMFLTYTVLLAVFGLTVLLEGFRLDSRPLKEVGIMLLVYLLVGAGTALYPVHVRGTAQFSDELPHIASGLVAVAVILVAMAIGSVALGSRFQRFSWMMFSAVVAFGALTVPFAVKLAAGEPTPGMGIVERLAYYSILAWIAGLSIAMLRRNAPTRAGDWQ